MKPDLWLRIKEEHLGFFTAVNQPPLVEVENQSRLPIPIKVDYFGYRIPQLIGDPDSNVVVVPTAITRFKVTIFPVRLTVWQRLKLLLLGRI